MFVTSAQNFPLAFHSIRQIHLTRLPMSIWKLRTKRRKRSGWNPNPKGSQCLRKKTSSGCGMLCRFNFEPCEIHTLRPRFLPPELNEFWAVVPAPEVPGVPAFAWASSSPFSPRCVSLKLPEMHSHQKEGLGLSKIHVTRTNTKHRTGVINQLELLPCQEFAKLFLAARFESKGWAYQVGAFRVGRATIPSSYQWHPIRSMLALH